MHKVEAVWTGKWPCLCYGEWILTIDGREINLPESVKDSPMNTEGKYRRWHFENWIEVWETYTSGLPFDEWATENQPWLSEITTDRELQREIYLAFQAHDWRHGSCGGCI